MKFFHKAYLINHNHTFFTSIKNKAYPVDVFIIERRIVLNYIFNWIALRFGNSCASCLRRDRELHFPRLALTACLFDGRLGKMGNSVVQKMYERSLSQVTEW